MIDFWLDCSSGQRIQRQADLIPDHTVGIGLRLTFLSHFLFPLLAFKFHYVAPSLVYSVLHSLHF